MPITMLGALGGACVQIPLLPMPDLGLIMHHKMNSGDISGNQLTNYAPSSSYSIVTGTITLQTSDKKVGTASARNTVSTNTQNILTTITLPAASTGCNVTFWMKSITNITSGMFVSFLVGTARITFRTIAVNNILRLEVNDGINGSATARNNLFTFTPNTWQHVSVNLHSTSPYITCYVNSSLVTTTTDNIRAMYTGNTYNLSIFGTAGGTEAQIWACDDFRIYERTLNAVDVQALYELT